MKAFYHKAYCHKVCFWKFCLILLILSKTLALAAEWTPAAAGFQYSFPADHSAHRDYKTEWWYFTGNVRDTASGHEYGYELTFFRQGVIPPGAGPLEDERSRFLQSDFKFAHLAISDLGKGRFRFAQKLTRGAFAEAGFATTADPKLIWLDDWSIAPQPDGSWRIRAESTSDPMSLDLVVKPTKPPVIQGMDGVSQKAAGFGNASHYYSFTRMATAGTLAIGKQSHTVRGESWFDHEWASNALAADQIGWNWFCFQFDDGTELMLYAMRRRDGSIDPVSNGTVIAEDGRSEHLTLTDFQLKPGRTWRSESTGGIYPLEWEVNVPSRQISLKLSARLDDQELVVPPISYWEGAIGVSGTKAGKPIKGVGYMELTGYAGALGGLHGNQTRAEQSAGTK